MEEIPVGKESKQYVSIGNKSNLRIKIQFSSMKENDRYELRIDPRVVTLKKGEACEFEIFVKPSISSNWRIITKRLGNKAKNYANM